MQIFRTFCAAVLISSLAGCSVMEFGEVDDESDTLINRDEGGDPTPTPSPTPIPAPEGACPPTTATWVNNRVELRDAETGAPLIMPRGVALHTPGKLTTLTPVVEMTPTECGFDLLYRFTNDTDATQILGTLQVGVITLGEHLTFQDFGYEGKAMPINFATKVTANFKKYNYPDKLYSPFGIVRNDQYAIGASLLYRAADWKHQARFSLRHPNAPKDVEGEGGPGWAMAFHLNDTTADPPVKMKQPATLAPGESREYVVAVRVTKRPDEWIRTALPYREHFRSLYGGRTYPLDTTPIKHGSISSVENCDLGNPFGLLGSDKTRADKHGFGPLVDNMLEANASKPWTRAMYWKPSGSFCAGNTNLNFPFQFTTFWMQGAEWNHNMGDAVEQFARLPAAGVELGLWWGRAVQVMAEWNPKTFEIFDIDNPDHVARAFAELDLAAAAGATYIGLDTFVPMGDLSSFELFEWLQMMRARYPQFKFVTETRRPDFLHFQAPTFAMALNKTENPKDPMELYDYTEPMYMADFLFLGAETWTIVHKSRLAIALGHPPSAEEMRIEWRRLAALGYAVVGTDDPLDPTYHAAETSQTTVPADLLY